MNFEIKPIPTPPDAGRKSTKWADIAAALLAHPGEAVLVPINGSTPKNLATNGTQSIVRVLQRSGVTKTIHTQKADAGVYFWLTDKPEPTP